MKVFLFVKTKTEPDEHGESRTRYNYSLQNVNGRHAPIGIDVVYVKDPKTGKDPLYLEYRSVLGAYADDLDAPVGVDPIELLCFVQNGTQNFYLVCGNVTVPIRVPDYSTAGKADNGHRLRVTMLYSVATLIKRKPTGLLTVSGVVTSEEGATDEEAPILEPPVIESSAQVLNDVPADEPDEDPFG